MSSMGNFGISFGIPAGFLCERFGARITSLAALVISCLGYMLLYSTTLMIEVYKSKAWLQYLYFFLAGFGSIFMYMASLTTSMNNFHPKHRGKIVGILDASFSGGPALFSALYGALFAVGHVKDEAHQNLSGFYFMTAIFINPIAGIVSKFFAGFLSDAIHHKVPRAAVLLAFNVVQTISLAISIFFSDKLFVFAIVNVIIGFANGAVWCLTPTMISEFYGMKFFARNWGAMMLGNAFGGLALSESFGWIYKSNITSPDATDCYGISCFTWSFILFAGLSFNACILEVALLKKKLDEKKYSGEDPNVEMCCPGADTSDRY
ncbi:hypothetical protein FSP39_009517 [Pinctada imbricata]|uniref:Major facilitator superfamily (MFS) profile domain-containing protein n=1 Tax=Pinctada imbricata TaxID=66713 RepID=A0AA88YSN0_PINIB|nr:hypothetical protein FSP39_009517 [Pinctada imbricata]